MTIATVEFLDEADFTLTDTAIVDSALELDRTQDFHQHNIPFNNESGYTLSPAAQIADGFGQNFNAFSAAKFVALWKANGLTADFATGSAAVSANTGSVAVDGNGGMPLNGTSQYIDYVAANNINFAQIGCINWGMKFNDAGIPAAAQQWFTICNAAGSGLSGLLVYHENSSGNIVIEVYSSAGATIKRATYSFTLKVPATLYEFELNYNFTTGLLNLYVNGTRVINHTDALGTRGNIGLFRLGADQLGNRRTPCTFEWFATYDTVQHTDASYTTRNVTWKDYLYPAASIVCPPLTYTTGIEGTREIQAITATDETNSPRYTIGGRYWNGSAWATSSGTYATASSAADLHANRATYPLDGDTELALVTYFQDSNTQSKVSKLDIDFSGELFLLDGSAIPTTGFSARKINYVDLHDTAPAGTSVGIIINVDGSDFYYDGAAWVASDGTLAQSNTHAEINAAIESFLSQESTIKFKTILHSDSNVISPSVTDIVAHYLTLGGSEAPETVTVYGYLKDASNTAIEGATVTILLRNEEGNEYHEAGNSVVSNDELTATTDADGYWEIELIRNDQFDADTFYEMNYEKTDTKTEVFRNAQKLLFIIPENYNAGDMVAVKELIGTI